MTKHTELIRAVFQRPKMYTTGGSYPEVIAFLDGYFSGLNSASVATSVWSELTDRITQTTGVPSTEAFREFGEMHDKLSLQAIAEIFEKLHPST